MSRLSPAISRGRRCVAKFTPLRWLARASLLRGGCVLIVLLGASPISGQEYFPPLVFAEHAASHSTAANWYSKHLQALKETSLWELSKDGKVHAYRFLWLRTFDHPVAVRLNVLRDGTGLLTTKIASGQGGYAPGRLTSNRTKRLTKQDVQAFLNNIEELRYWSLPSFEKNSNQVEVDGARWIFEGVKDGRYHVVDRWSPERGSVRILGLLMLLDLARLKLPYQEVY